jgi:uncharacterized membrane protein
MDDRLMTGTGAPADGPEPSATLRLRDLTKMPLLIVAGMFAAGALLYPYLPSPIPTHWGVSGLPDAFSPKTPVSVFLQPLIALAVYGLLLVAPALDSKRRNLKLSIGAYNLIVDAVVGMQAVIFAGVLIAAFRPGFDVVGVTLLSTGLLMMVVGNLMRTVRQNRVLGVRTSWTLSDEVVWRRTNALGGQLFIAAGAVTAVCAFLPAPWALGVMTVAVLGVSAVTIAYSYVLFRSRHPDA